MYSVYTLSDPESNAIRYVGISANPCLRFGLHLANSSSGRVDNEPKNAWIRGLTARDLMPILTIIEKVETKAEAADRETYWILYHLDTGSPLLNGTLGDTLKRYKHPEPNKSPRLNIRALRLEQKWKQSDLSKNAKVSIGIISQIEKGGHIPSLEIQERLASALGVTVEQLHI